MALHGAENIGTKKILTQPTSQPTSPTANSSAQTYLPLHRAIQAEARRLGFDLCRLVSVATAPHADFFAQWIGAGRAGEMGYLARNIEKRREPWRLVDSEQPVPQTMIVLGVNHYQFDLPATLRDDPSRGIIASYAWGNDYHEIIRPLLYELDAFICARTGRSSQGKCLVDTGPVLERDWAQRAGLGFVGKNCCLIHPSLGSWLLLATVLIPEALPADPPLQSLQDAPPPTAVFAGLQPDAVHGAWLPLTEKANPRQMTCGRCTRCLDACPTDAFIGPYHLDPQHCISYWTIEAKGAIPRHLRSHFGNRIFGCDICQEVCPWNRQRADRQPVLNGLHAQIDRIAPSLLAGFEPATPYWIEQAAFAERFRGSPIKRAKRTGMLRNVCVALGNWGVRQTVPALVQALTDESPIVRGHAAWALGQVGQKTQDPVGWQRLTAALATETDDNVREEIANVIG